MGAMFRLNADGFALSAGARLVKAEELGPLYDANSMIAEARRKAEEIAREAETAYEQRREQGYKDGAEEGKMEHAEKMMETILSSVEFIEGIENTLVSVVTQAIRKIIGEMDDKERIVQIVRTALNTVRGQQKVTVRVAPADEPAVSQAFSAMTSAAPGGGAFLTVLADARLSPNSCILESELGVVDASLETQLKALEKAFQAKIRQ